MLRVAPVSLQRERAFVAILQQRTDLTEVVHLALTHRRPNYFSVLVFEIAEVYMEDACRVELPIAIGERTLTGFGCIVRIPRHPHVVFFDALQKFACLLA